MKLQENFIVSLAVLFLFFSRSDCQCEKDARTERKDEVCHDALFDGKVDVGNGTVWAGELTWAEDVGLETETRSFAFYGYKYGIAERFKHSKENYNFAYLQNPRRPKRGHICPQLSGNPTRNITMAEDCLYLDVYLPPFSKIHPQKLWPVLFWIYGGGFKIGDKNMYNAIILAQSIDSIVITANYRLGPFGFLSTSDAVARGNWAIGDLKLALAWTLRSIHAFNGDVSKVTIAGQSAGSALVSALMLDDWVRGTVFAAIAMSGSIIHPYNIRKRPQEGTNKLARALNCPTDQSTALIACLQTKSVNDILRQSRKSVESGSDHMGKYFAPVLDTLHITKEPMQILKDRAARGVLAPDGRQAAVISGFLTDDTSFFFMLAHPELIGVSFTFPMVSELLTELLTVENTVCPQNIPVQVEQILWHYNLTNSSSPQELRKGYYNATSEAVYGSSSMRESSLYSDIEPKNNYMYEISFDPGFNNIGAFHTLEVIHLFRGAMDSHLVGKINETLTKVLHDFYREITHNGHPKNHAKFGDQGNYQILDQNAVWKPQIKDFRPTLNFWKNIAKLGQRTPGTLECPSWPFVVPPGPTPTIEYSASSRLFMFRVDILAAAIAVIVFKFLSRTDVLLFPCDIR